eukprot:gene5538-6100_t
MAIGCKVLLIVLSLFNILISAYQPLSHSGGLRSKSSFLLQASKGFGSKPATPSSTSTTAAASSSSSSATSSYLASLHEGNKQITKMTKLDELCLCQSGLTYGECCHRWHQLGLPHPPQTSNKVDEVSTTAASPNSHSGDGWWSPTELVRARYTAFAFGLPAFLILTTHPKHKDYIRFSESKQSPAKAIKAWSKEIVNGNSAAFEFFKLQILSEDDPADINLMRQNYKDMEKETFRTVRFRVVAKQRSTQKLVPFEEVSAFMKSQPGIGFLGSELADHLPFDKADTAVWTYVHGIVSAIEENALKAITADLPAYANKATIRDRW